MKISEENEERRGEGRIREEEGRRRKGRGIAY